MGKSKKTYYRARRGLSLCLSCKRPIIYGERCPPCASDLRRRAARKPR